MKVVALALLDGCIQDKKKVAETGCVLNVAFKITFVKCFGSNVTILWALLDLLCFAFDFDFRTIVSVRVLMAICFLFGFEFVLSVNQAFSLIFVKHQQKAFPDS